MPDDLRTRLTDLIYGTVSWRDVNVPVASEVADAVIAELGLREERWKSNDPKMLRGYWTRHCTDWTPPTDGKADDE